YVLVHLRALLSFPTRRSSDLGFGIWDSRDSCTVVRWLRIPNPQSRIPSQGGMDGRAGTSTRRFTIGRMRGRSGGGTCHSGSAWRSEEHTSELQSLRHLVCRLL